jgi:LDH2 family malate/lactate/ureidoglycolate dehydrogenase
MGQRSPFGGVKKDAKPRIVKETPATVVIEADRCIGPKVTMWATEMIIEKAKVTGIAAATVHNCVHNGTMAYYMDRIARADMIGMGFTCTGGASPPWGGVERMLGTSPFGMGFPAKTVPPIVIDMSTSATSHAGLTPMLASGKPVPEGILLDEFGEPTTDPKKFVRASGPGVQAKGSIANMANNHKGYAVQLATEILGGILPSLMSGGESIVGASYNNPSFLIAINISFFQDLGAFKEKMDSRVKQLKASRKKPGVDEIFMPGERSYRNQERYRTEGIPVDDHVWKEIEKLADEVKVRLPNLATTPA